MYHYATQPSQREKVISGAVAAGMHLMFLALLVFGVNWQRHVEPTVNVVDLWPAPAAPAPKAVPAPAPPPPPEVKPEPKVVAPVPPRVAPKPEVVRPDIALKDKEKAAKEKADKEKADKEKRAVEDKQKAAKKKEEEAQKAQAAEAQRAVTEQAEAQRRVAEQAASAQARLRGEYIERIRTKIKRFIILPPNIQGNPEADFDVILLPDGNPLAVKLKRSSGNTAYDTAVERAITKAQPLPLPPDPVIAREFRELNLKFKAQE